MWRSLVPLVVVVALGCTSVRQRAETAYSKGRYREAAELFDRLVQRDPNDRAARQRRTDARYAVLREMLVAVQAARRARKLDRARALLEDLLDQRAAWEMAVDPQSAPALAVEVAAAGDAVTRAIDRVAAAAGPLAAEARLADHAHLLGYADFGDRAPATAARLRAMGAARCQALAADTAAAEPSWSWLVGRYCAHFGATAAIARGAFADRRTALVLDGAIDGLSEPEAAALRDVVADAFHASAWYAPNGTGALRGQVRGAIAVTFSQRAIVETAPWTEEVPYTDYVTEQESYEEPYDEVESYSEQVPYTEYQPKTVPCGETTCTTTEPVTVYRTEWKTRTVTKYRTAWRDVTRPVTRYRSVPHVFQYGATAHAGHYVAELAVAIAAGPPLDVTATTSRDDTATGVAHDVTFEPAGVAPQRPNLPTRARVIADERARLAAELVASLDARYAETYCAAATYTRDAAAACAYLDPTRVPAPVRVTLRATFGGDEPFLAAILTRAR